jgi:hypothetical protein
MSLLLRRFLRKNLPLGRGQVLPKSSPPADHINVKPAPTGILFARNLLNFTSYLVAILSNAILASELIELLHQ